MSGSPDMICKRMISKVDYVIAGFIGFLVGVFSIPTLLNIGIRDQKILLAVPLIIPFIWAIGVWFGGMLARRIRVFAQFSKFVAVGFLNTALDFGVLNLLSMITGITAGFVVGGVNIPGVALSVTNAYFWNKLWVFKDRDDKNIFSDLPKFAVVSIAGILINSGIVILLTTYVPAPVFLTDERWLNLAKVGASFVSLITNFLGYKFLVFRA